MELLSPCLSLCLLPLALSHHYPQSCTRAYGTEFLLKVLGWYVWSNEFPASFSELCWQMFNLPPPSVSNFRDLNHIQWLVFSLWTEQSFHGTVQWNCLSYKLLEFGNVLVEMLGGITSAEVMLTSPSPSPSPGPLMTSFVIWDSLVVLDANCYPCREFMRLWVISYWQNGQRRILSRQLLNSVLLLTASN